MDFRKIDDNTVQCRMTEEEMNEYGLQIEDFFTDQEKSRDFENQMENMMRQRMYELERGQRSRH